MFRNGDLTGSKTLKEGRLAGSVGSNKTVTTTEVQVDVGVGDELAAVEGEREGLDLDIAGQGLRGQHTGAVAVTSLLLGKVHGTQCRGQGIAILIIRNGGVTAVGVCGCRSSRRLL